MKLFCENNSRLLTVIYFRKNVSSKIFRKALNMLCYSKLHYTNVLNVFMIIWEKYITAMNIGVNTTLPWWYLRTSETIGPVQILYIYLHTKNRFHSTLRSQHTSLLKIQQFDWLRALALTHLSKTGTILTALMKIFI